MYISTDINEIKPTDYVPPFEVRVFDGLEQKYGHVIRDEDDMESWAITLERSVWRLGMQPEKIEKAVDPSHYKNYVDDYQWLETMSKIPTLRDPDRFIASVEMQVRKYLDRNGQKDHSLQELLKARWYLTFLCAYIKNGNKAVSPDKMFKYLDEKDSI
jgi:hypothetical protein